MTHEQARRFARKCIEDHGDEGTFSIGLPAEDLEPVAEALRELGCEATIHNHKAWIEVRCPEHLRVPPTGPHMG